MSVEVERKFVCNADTPQTLEEIGAVCIGQRQFHDQYFDTPDFDLTLQDMWLRRRKGCWELKCPMTAAGKTKETHGEESKEAALCTRYKEITDLTEIQMRVTEVLKDICGHVEVAYQSAEQRTEDGPEKDKKVSPQDEDLWQTKMNLGCFAEYTTVRRSFVLEKEGVQIDLDHADFDYHVGEIEVLLPQGGDVQSALEKIERTARKLGLAGQQRVEGKMHVYLKKNHPEHYANLLRAHVL
ncbi:thiamine-triphosphatase [Genypterus blacodes]|uniref:thiamine-triphosphatase n=1 Tax=Genypterus blacodes TaxID=154954 RepID=UPI003F75ECFD